MIQNIRMDSHKLIYHPGTVSRWLSGENIYPIEIEISPSGACNHRCTFCALDYLGYEPSFLDKDIILRDIRKMKEKGLKSVLCSGEGEPLLNKDFPEIVNSIKCMGVDVAMSTNGALFSEDKAEACLGAFSWIRFSVAAFEENAYYEIQRANPGDLERVKTNLRDAVRVKTQRGYATTLGVQCLLLKENMEQLPQMAEELRDIGVDYLTIKPFSQHLHSGNQIYMDYEALVGLEEDLKKYVTDRFSVFFRANAMHKMHRDKTYTKCLGLPFMTHIDSKGNVWPCVAHIGSEEYCYGNIYEQTFEEIWEGIRRQEVVERLYNSDINSVCREACRLDEINKYLWDLKNPGAHVNFI